MGLSQTKRSSAKAGDSIPFLTVVMLVYQVHNTEGTMPFSSCPRAFSLGSQTQARWQFIIRQKVCGCSIGVVRWSLALVIHVKFGVSQSCKPKDQQYFTTPVPPASRPTPHLFWERRVVSNKEIRSYVLLFLFHSICRLTSSHFKSLEVSRHRQTILASRYPILCKAPMNNLFHQLACPRACLLQERSTQTAQILRIQIESSAQSADHCRPLPSPLLLFSLRPSKDCDGEISAFPSRRIRHKATRLCASGLKAVLFTATQYLTVWFVPILPLKGMPLLKSKIWFCLFMILLVLYHDL
jgi:hypothetical protein